QVRLSEFDFLKPSVSYFACSDDTLALVSKPLGKEARMSWARKLSEPYRIDSGKNFRLKDFDPRTTGHFKSKEHAEELLEQGIAEMADQQDKLYAQDRWAVLLIFQAMDAAGKDGAIKHVMSGVNPQGVQVYSFKAPSAEELN